MLPNDLGVGATVVLAVIIGRWADAGAVPAVSAYLVLQAALLAESTACVRYYSRRWRTR